jgi:hypothetical protein
MSIAVPHELWNDIRDFFAALVASCKDCVRGNPIRCWNSDCAAFPFRDLARRIVAVSVHAPVHVPRHVAVENEILDALHRCGGGPVYPSQIALTTTRSKVDKSHAISRLIKQGRIVEERINDYTRRISLPTNGNPKGKNNNEPTKPTDRGGIARRSPARELGAGSPNACAVSQCEQTVRD